MLQTLPDMMTQAYQASPLVNSPKNDSSEVISLEHKKAWI
jgi:hypothetical protein